MKNVQTAAGHMKDRSPQDSELRGINLYSKKTTIHFSKPLCSDVWRQAVSATPVVCCMTERSRQRFYRQAVILFFLALIMHLKSKSRRRQKNVHRSCRRGAPAILN